MQTENPTPATRTFMSGPELNATLIELLPSALSLNEARRRPSSSRLPSGQMPANLLPSALYLLEARQTTGKNRTPLPLPHLLIHHFLHSSDGFLRAVLRHITGWVARDDPQV